MPSGRGSVNHPKQVGVTQGDPLSMVLYGITLISLVVKICVAVTYILEKIYADDAAFDGPVDMSSSMMALLLEWGPVRGYSPEPAKSIFICGSHTQKETTNQEFEFEGLRINVVPGIQYLGRYIDPVE